MPCLPARARELLRKGKAAVYRRIPFTIILKHREGGDLQPLAFKVDPGSKTTGLALILQAKQGAEVIWAADLQHKGAAIAEALEKRRGLRSARRSRKCRHRQCRPRQPASIKGRPGEWQFRKYRPRRVVPKGWLSPCMRSRLANIVTWRERLIRLCPLTSTSMELNKFDTQKMQNPEISGVEYQRGTLYGYEVWSYLLEKWGRKCAYDDAQDVPLEIDHIIPRSRGGSDRISNLTLACRNCNERKGNKTIEEFLAHDPERLKSILRETKDSLRDVAALSSMRFALLDALRPQEIGTGGQTMYNRTRQAYPKQHWVDAACVGESGASVYIAPIHMPLQIRAIGRGHRRMCAVDKFGFPRHGYAPRERARRKYGLQTGDLVKVTKGKYAGKSGRAVVRKDGSCYIPVEGNKRWNFTWDSCQLLQRANGYWVEQKERTWMRNSRSGRGAWVSIP